MRYRIDADDEISFAIEIDTRSARVAKTQSQKR